MKLLEKTRKINKLLQKGDKVEFNAIAKLLRDVIEANTYIVGRKGGVKGYALIHEFECDIMREQVLDDMRFPEDYLGFIMSVKETLANIPHQNQNCSFVADTKCIFNGKMTTVVPIYGNGERLGTLIVAKYDAEFDDDDLLLAEYAATVLGVEILHDREAVVSEEIRKKATVQVAFSTLSYSELEAIVNIMGELNGNEGLLVASKIADRVGITRSVIVNALRKFESAGLIETKSLGMKGTYIRVLGEDLAMALGTCGTMSFLLRTQVGAYTIDKACTLQEIAENPEACAAEPLTAVAELPKLKVNARQAARITNGVRTTVAQTADGRYVLLGPGDEFLGIVRCEQERLQAEKILEHYPMPEE